jgi:adenylate cyclase, class 2
MKEIEVKAYIKNKSKVLEKLNSLGLVFSEPIRQIDTVYTRIPAKTVEEYLKNDHFVRIREKSDGKYIFTVKRPLSKMVLDKLEYETEVKDVSELEHALLLMGYQIANKIIKTRSISQYKEIEICLDDVEGMGSFIELEKVTEEDSSVIRKELNEFLALLEIPLSEEVHKGYDILAIENQ